MNTVLWKKSAWPMACVEALARLAGGKACANSNRTTVVIPGTFSRETVENALGLVPKQFSIKQVGVKDLPFPVRF